MKKKFKTFFIWDFRHIRAFSAHVRPTCIDILFNFPPYYPPRALRTQP